MTNSVYIKIIIIENLTVNVYVCYIKVKIYIKGMKVIINLVSLCFHYLKVIQVLVGV